MDEIAHHRKMLKGSGMKYHHSSYGVAVSLFDTRALRLVAKAKQQQGIYVEARANLPSFFLIPNGTFQQLCNSPMIHHS
jgi:hypothetical protein